ncbi:23S rRNA (guanosine(2251)-2'-O)-methyltransferase RlmB [Pullulanibacillus sp. KACC 23026]|uniref:23S rRNA (guanosine(2251)-2'-O)-methyltransferase RlmB n=1 Tax=Pullulanibacillus sp. KACC 23026 TaxID=3028315 RepID=UPI0023AF7C01|nr:23S rRNA (guanosine(2251)-2'-O)-methyltransferase RlmB [Pullulanibacillus sp. KACC 23026]WEG12690.1 23S rRNA (guanosine(2251)-2'-O)-methyltransferase RlmB [Pullulanibacillus sp. KACC 23026]
MADEWIIGRHPVAEAIESGREINKIWINKQSQGLSQDLMNKVKERKITVQFVPRQKLDQLAGSERHQGIVASVAAHEYAEIDDLFDRAKERGEDPFFILLDGLEDPHNLGSVLRTADAVGAHGVIIPKNRAVGLTSVVAKASTGAIEYIPVTRVTNLARTMKELKERGVWFVGTAADAPKDYKKMEAKLPLCLVIGNEGKGISRLVREACDFLVSIPMRGKVTSLNASVAAGLLLYEIQRIRETES